MNSVRKQLASVIVLGLLVAAQPFGLATVHAQSVFKKPAQTYAALGDSIASGAGLTLTDNSPETLACDRSTQSYPYQVSSELGMELTDVTCSGASVPAGLTGPQTTNGLTLPAQISRAFQKGAPKLMTISIGTNDIHWSTFINECYVTTCGSGSDSAAVAALDQQLYQNLSGAMTKIKQMTPAGKPVPRVALVGYYQPLTTSAPACGDTQGLTVPEIQWIRSQAHLLNSTLRRVADEHGFSTYVPIDFTGHELCSKDPWVQGLTAQAPYHPTAAGQAAIAFAIVARLGHCSDW